MPFYGYDYGQGVDAITGSKYLEILKSSKPKIQWNEEEHEHFFYYEKGGIRHVVYYPSLMVFM